MGPHALRVARKYKAIHVDVINLRFILVGYADFQVGVHVMLIIHQHGYLIDVVVYAVHRIGRIVDGQLLTAVDIRLLCGLKYQFTGFDGLGGGRRNVRRLLVGIPVGTYVLICIEIQLCAGELIAAAHGAGLLNQTHIPCGIGLLKVRVNPVAHIVEAVLLMQIVGLFRKFSGSREGVIGSILADIQLEFAHGSVETVISVAVARTLVDGQGGYRLHASQVDVHCKRTSGLGVFIRIGIRIAVNQSCCMRVVKYLSAVIGDGYLPGASVQSFRRLHDFLCLLKGSGVETNLSAGELLGASDGYACLYYTDIPRVYRMAKIGIYQIAYVVEVAFLMQVVIRLGKFALGYFIIIGYAIGACPNLIAAHGAVGSVIGIRITRPLVDGHGRDCPCFTQVDIQSKRMSADSVLVRIAAQLIVKQGIHCVLREFCTGTVGQLRAPAFFGDGVRCTELPLGLVGDFVCIFRRCSGFCGIGFAQCVDHKIL